MNHRSGILYLVSGPSGSGKTTLCQRLANEGLANYAISATTRPPREGEKHGKNYYFHDIATFKKKVAAGEFIEHAEVHGNFYGTLKSEVLDHLAKGTDVVMDIDVQGATSVRKCDDELIQRALVDLFVMPPSEASLHERLTGRGTDSKAIIARRMTNALEEMQHWKKYNYCLLSGTKEEDYEKFKSLLIAERLRSKRLTH